ncbi:M16 family metallopeptidase [Pelagerythrobacter sp.]|uniref:M16 family metallopeptidase n=1 Tax=Pelagerythrobacter sp. TaxID=2800702 RepID=UPI0035ADF96F
MTGRFVRRAIAALPLVALALPLAAQDAPEPAPVAAEAAATPSGTTPWGFPVYDIPADPAVRYGVLGNGMKYAVLQNATPRETAVVRFGFDVGWVDELDSELGLAHFIEHMAFNGSTNIPEGEMIKLLEREGLAFGADTNASTGFEETIYKLDLPRTDPALMDTALMLMRETASELTIAPEAVDRERGVIQSETRTRNNFAIRRIKHYLDFVAPQTRFATRFRADGTNETIDAAAASVLRGLYSRYYRPDNATLVVVGDIEPAAVEEKIREKFSDWQMPAGAMERIGTGTIDLERGPEAANFVDPDVQYIVSIDRFLPYEAPETSIEHSRETLLLGLGSAMLNRRFETIVNGADAPIVSGGAGASDFFDVADQASVTVQAKEGEWREALAVAEQEWRRAAEHGFTQGELDEQLANFELRFRTAAEQAAARQNGQLADGILNTVQRETLFVTPATRYEIFQQLRDGLTVDAVNAAFREHFALTAPLIHVSTKEPIADPESTILAAYDASMQVAVAPPADRSGAAFAYDDFGTPGAIAADTTIEDLGIRSIRFANNVRLNLKRTDFEEGRVRFQVRLGSGQLSIPADRSADAIFLSSLFGAGGLGEHGYDDLRQILAGRNVTYGYAVTDDKFAVSGATTMADFPLQMQVSAAYASDPGLRPEIASRWQSLLPPFLAQGDATPQNVAQFEVPRIVADGNSRFGIPPEEQLAAVTPDGARAVIADQFAAAPIEISVVGDIDEQAVIDAVAASFGALPDRSADLAAFPEARQAQFASDTAPVTLYHAGAPDQALVQIYWPTDDDDDARAEAAMNLLAAVARLELTEEIRENLGASYSPGAFSNMSNVYDGFGTFGTSVVVAPDQADEVFEAVDSIAEELKSAPVTDDLLDRARKPMLEQLAVSKRQNPYWLAVLSEAQLRADRLDRVRDYEERLRAVTPEMLQALAQRYLDPAKALRIRIVHQSLAPDGEAAGS